MSIRRIKKDYNDIISVSEDNGIQSQVTCFDRIFRKILQCNYSDKATMDIEKDIAFITGIYHIDEPSAILLAAILEATMSNNGITDDNLADYIGCTNIAFIRYLDLLRKMKQSGLICHSNYHGQRKYKATAEMIKAVESNGNIEPLKMSGLTADELFSRFDKLFDNYKKYCIDEVDLIEELDSLISLNNHLVFCRKIIDSPLYSDCSATERRIFLYLCNVYVRQGEKAVAIDTLTNFTDAAENSIVIKRHFANEMTPLQINGLVNFAIDDGFADSRAICLSDEVKESFLCGIESAPEEQIRHKDIICCKTIKAKELFYNESEGAQIARLENLLDERHLIEVQSRLSACGMRRGFNAIFYGVPGTGKTASVYELARRSGRDIFHVDMAKLKSKWVGDSEKSVRSVFKYYRYLCNTQNKVPILLFNEADAIFSKRIEKVEQSVDQMNNSLQNIILEEMEDIEGILIATTNLISNLDSAFERRFLFKVEFKLPEKESRARIWKSMIPNLTEEEASSLAAKYTFSGGNIENVARKSTVDYVLTGNGPTVSTLESYCQEEMLNRKKPSNRIGF